MATPTKQKGGTPHPSNVYHRYTWMGNGWMPRAIRRAKGR